MKRIRHLFFFSKGAKRRKGGEGMEGNGGLRKGEIRPDEEKNTEGRVY